MGVGTDDGSDGTLTLQQDGTWQGEGKNGVNNRRVTLTVTHTEGKAVFANGDEFKFSTFKSNIKGNEIGTGSCTVPPEDP